MRSTRIANVIIAASLVLGQDISDIPLCSLKCLVEFTPLTGCEPATNFKCICRESGAMVASMMACSQASCSTQDAEATPEAFRKLCKEAGVKIHPNSTVVADSMPEVTPTGGTVATPLSLSSLVATDPPSSTSPAAAETAGTNAGVAINPRLGSGVGVLLTLLGFF
ncbi:hypothetical protein DL98DRAFT_589452 [Cadophora sp. DSE1049]|nr:hypothetical protein DL98DRAFT_589452 [Cadophora sp. DSE1049]